MCELFDSTSSCNPYNKRDVEVEMAIQKRLIHFPVPDFVWDEYHEDQEINDRGIALDMQLVRQAISSRLYAGNAQGRSISQMLHRMIIGMIIAS